MSARQRSQSATRLEIRNRFAPRFSSSVRIDTTKLYPKDHIVGVKHILTYDSLYDLYISNRWINEKDVNLCINTFIFFVTENEGYQHLKVLQLMKWLNR
ncbi:unnamed protein product [Thelazia callipaeda]|uniref:Uncharacterized protein n=1 Tax=Thelazia callipaeda TaxID=103827 RepID=A0A0N5CWL6_THECL|nr:unnamed protein product [Thelazia callipaeda]